MTKHLFLLLTTCALFAADDHWDKARDLKSGTEIRVYKTGSKTPVIAKIDEANENVWSWSSKTPRPQYRRKKSSELTRVRRSLGAVSGRNRSTKTTNPDIKPSTPGLAQQSASTPSTSTSSGLSVGSKPGFETIYRRTASKTSSK